MENLRYKQNQELLAKIRMVIFSLRCLSIKLKKTQIFFLAKITQLQLLRHKNLITRRAIVYTFTFETRIRYYRGIGTGKQILETAVDFSEALDPTTHKFETLAVDGTTTSDGAGGFKEPYTETINFFDTDV